MSWRWGWLKFRNKTLSSRALSEPKKLNIQRSAPSCTSWLRYKKKWSLVCRKKLNKVWERWKRRINHPDPIVRRGLIAEVRAKGRKLGYCWMALRQGQGRWGIRGGRSPLPQPRRKSEIFTEIDMAAAPRPLEKDSSSERSESWSRGSRKSLYPDIHRRSSLWDLAADQSVLTNPVYCQGLCQGQPHQRKRWRSDLVRNARLWKAGWRFCSKNSRMWHRNRCQISRPSKTKSRLYHLNSRPPTPFSHNSRNRIRILKARSKISWKISMIYRKGVILLKPR